MTFVSTTSTGERVTNYCTKPESNFEIQSRLMHHPLLYKRFHKRHHEWKAPVAAVAAYVHPVDHILTGIVSASIGPLISGSPLSVNWVWIVWIIMTGHNEHSGYHFPFFASTEQHDYHHAK